MARSEKVHVLVVDDDPGRGRVSNVESAHTNGAAVHTNGSSPSNGAAASNGALSGHLQNGQAILKGHDDSAQDLLARVVADVIGSGDGLDMAMARIEAAVIREALKQQRGNRSAAARQLQLPRQTLQDRMKKHGLWSS